MRPNVAVPVAMVLAMARAVLSVQELADRMEVMEVLDLLDIMTRFVRI